MRDILIKNKTAGSGSLPALINLVQYNTKENTSGEVNKDDSVGTMANNMFAFAIDLPYIDKKPATNSFRILDNLFSQLRYPTISRTHLEEMFYIFEIPDYGHQALSPYYQDFMVMMFREDGTKILQKYIGHIRSYYNKTMYILVDKTTNIDTTVNIRVIFKSGVDRTDANQGFTFTREKNTDTFIATFNEENSEFPFIGKDISSFNIFLQYKPDTKEAAEYRFINAFNPDLFKIEFTNEDQEILIQQQSEYFSELYNVDFRSGSSIPEIKDDSISVSLTCPLPDDITKIILRTPQVTPEFLVYNKENFYDDEYFGFDENGVYTPSESDRDPYELIPIFNKSRLIILSAINPNVAKLNDWLLLHKHYRYDIDIQENDKMVFYPYSDPDVAVVYIFDDNLPRLAEFKASLDSINLNYEPAADLLKLSTDNEKSNGYTVINDPYLVTMNTIDSQTGAIHILNIPEEITTDDDITSANFSNDFLDSSDNIMTNIKSIADNLLKPYRYIVDTFLVNFLKNSKDFSEVTTDNTSTKIFLVEMSNANEIVIETERGKEIIKGYQAADGKYYGITDSRPISGTIKSLF